MAHFVTPLKCMYDKYDWRVRNHTKSTNHLTNTITMVVEPLAPAAAYGTSAADAATAAAKLAAAPAL